VKVESERETDTGPSLVTGINIDVELREEGNEHHKNGKSKQEAKIVEESPGKKSTISSTSSTNKERPLEH